MSEEDEKRAKQLEEARKRVEELKNKKKKNKKKNKKNKNKDTEQTDASESDINKEDTVEKNESETAETTKIDNIEVESEPVETLDITDEKPEHSPANESEAEGTDIKDEVPQLEAEKLESHTEEEPITEHVEEDIVESTPDVVEDTQHVTITEIKPVPETETEPIPETIETTAAIATTKNDDVNQLFDDDANVDEGDDFLSSIQKEKDSIEIEKLNEQIKKMAEEIKKLKFMNMEQETTIEEQEAELEENKISLQNANNEIDTLKSKITQLETGRNSQEPAPVMQFAQFNSPQPNQNMVDNNNGQQYIQEPVIDRVMLDKWHNWNIDMTSWRSIGSGPIVEF